MGWCARIHGADRVAAHAEIALRAGCARSRYRMFTCRLCEGCTVGGLLVEIVIGDVHARSEALRALLTAVGALDEHGRRARGFWIVQVGDLLDRRAGEYANLATARLAASAIDIVLAGNHEARMLADREGVGGAALATLAARGWPHAAAALGDWLITHAGVHPTLARELPFQAEECAAEINDRWHRRAPGEGGEPLFDWIGPARGGKAPYGGILWTHPIEWRGAGETPWGQILGHVPQPEPRLLPGRRWAIDLGARDRCLAALVRAPSQRRWRPVVVDAPAKSATVAQSLRTRAAA
jgi:hypothetical protein